MPKYIVKILVFLCVPALAAHGAIQEEQKTGPLLAPLNIDFLEFVQKQPLSGADAGGSLIIPAPVNMDHLKGTPDPQVQNTTFPPTYDLRELGKMNPTVKTQVGFSCWFHSVMASMESCLLPDEPRTFEAEIPNDPAYHGFNTNGGNRYMASAILTRWDAPLFDPVEEYNYWQVGRPGDVQKHIQQVVFLPKREGPLDNGTMKWFIMNQGAVYVGVSYEQEFFNFDTNAFYRYKDSYGLHGVTFLGWDDHFDRANFKHPPPGDGAFIARNTFGPGWGEGGYFYVSYYDISITPHAMLNNAESVDNYHGLYQHDPYGFTSSAGRHGEYWGANVFTARDNRPLQAVGFYATDFNSQYRLYVYKHPGPGNPAGGTLAAVKTGTFTYAGYYTLELDTQVPLAAGDRFSVVIYLKNPRYRFPIAIEKPIEGYSDNAAANPGESFISADGARWDDLTDVVPGGNVCIKAYTAALPRPQVLGLQVERTKTWEAGSATFSWVTVGYNETNAAGMGIQHLEVYRRAGGVYTLCRRVDLSELDNGVFSFDVASDGVPAGEEVAYHVAAFDSSGGVVARSPEERVKVGG